MKKNINGCPSGATNWATILTDQAEGIATPKGPISSLYGGGAMGGALGKRFEF